MTTLWVVVLSLVPHSGSCSTRVEVIELNHLYDGDCRHYIDQYIFWDWVPGHDELRVIDYWLVRGNVAGKQLGEFPGPYPRRGRDEVVLIFQRREGRRRVAWKVRATVFHRSWTQFDPEIFDGQFLSRLKRPGLGGDHGR